MARVKLTEFRAKKLLLGEEYPGIALAAGETPDAPMGEYVLKVDEGVKKRMKRGLVALKVRPADVAAKTAEWAGQGFSNFILEPFFPHEAGEERYLSLERVRGGIRLMHAAEGGIEVEEHPEKVVARVVAGAEEAAAFAKEQGLPEPFLRRLVEAFDAEFLAFLEINPLVVRGGEAHLLDAALLADSAGAYFAKGWSMRDVPKAAAKHDAETEVAALAATTPASLRLSVINPDGALFFLLSGGGGSIVIADAAALAGFGKEIANYGEYSGGPSREETYLYARQVLRLLLASSAPKKALIIAGGVANFTDVKATFAGIIDALREVASELRAAQARVYVRRGGPNEAEGLAMMRAFLEEEGVFGSIAGSEAVITDAIDAGIAYLKS
jgi:succinyl-CoA synthetase beta subunit